MIGELGAKLIGERARVMTHCNAAPLPPGLRPALGVIRSAKNRIISVIANETAPTCRARASRRGSGAEKIPCTLSRTHGGHLMSRG